MGLRCKYIYSFFGLLSCYLPEAFAKEEVMIDDGDRLKICKDKISASIYHKKESFEEINNRALKMSSLARDFKGWICENVSFNDVAYWCYKDYKDYFKGKQYNIDMEQYNDILKKPNESLNASCVYNLLYEKNKINNTLQDSLYYDLGQANSDLRLFDENGGVVECLLGEENKDNVVLKYLLSQAIMNATNNCNFNDREELLHDLMKALSFNDLYKTFLDLTQYASLFRLFEPGDMFYKFGLPTEVLSRVFCMIDEYISVSIKSYWDDEEMKWYSSNIVFNNNDINKTTQEQCAIWRILDFTKILGVKSLTRLMRKYSLIRLIYAVILAIAGYFVVGFFNGNSESKRIGALAVFVLFWGIQLWIFVGKNSEHWISAIFRILLTPVFWLLKPVFWVIKTFFLVSVFRVICFFIMLIFLLLFLDVVLAVKSKNSGQKTILQALKNIGSGYAVFLGEKLGKLFASVLMPVLVMILMWYGIWLLSLYTDITVPQGLCFRFYDCVYSDVFSLSLLDGMCKKKDAIKKFLTNIDKFFKICHNNPSMKKLTEKFIYDKNFIRTWEYYSKDAYSNIQYEYGDDNISQVSDTKDLENGNDKDLKNIVKMENMENMENINSNIQTMFLYLDKCKDFDIDKDYYRYPMSKINEFLNDYVIFFYNFRYCYKFFQSVIRDIYNVGIYLYAVNLIKNRNFCLAEFNPDSGSGQLSLEIKNSKHILLGDSCVSNNIVFDNKCQNIIFHGLNGAGKTIFLSQTLLNVIFAQSLGVAYADSYKGDCIQKIITSFTVDINIDVANSKFMQELLNMDKIFLFTDGTVCNGKILFALDEICSGTDPRSGEKIVKNFYVALMKLGGHVIAATHYSTPSEIEEEYVDLLCCNYMFDTYVDDKTGEIIYKRTITRGVPKYSLAGAVVKNMYSKNKISKQLYDVISI